MRKSLALLLLLLSVCYGDLAAQIPAVTIIGHVHNAATTEVIAAVSVAVKNSSAGTFTDDKGNFRLTVSSKLPVTLIVSSIGFETKEVVVSAVTESIKIDLGPASTLGQDVVVAATRVATRIMESPVSIERLNSTAIRETPASSFYDAIGNLKGVDVVASSLSFKTVSTRGFNGSGNLRMNQLIDGMDNQAPGLNFSVGNIVGITELDLDNVELLPGASSALYGAGGMNGTLLMTSKNPFKYQGLSVQIKQGVNHLGDDQTGAQPFYDWQARWAKAFNNKFAFKLSVQYTKAQDWQASDHRNFSSKIAHPIAGDRSLPSYNGINTYGDEVNFNLTSAIRSSTYAALAPLVGNDSIVSRTGYNEKDLVNYSTSNFKVGGSVLYKLTNTTEASLTGYWGLASTLYTGADRFSLKSVKIGQYKAEVKGRSFYVRAYTTQENSGDSYNITVLSQLLNESASPTKTSWAPTYIQNFITARLGGATSDQAHVIARDSADKSRLLPGTAAFKSATDAIKSKPIPQGALFLDRSDLYVAEGLYNFQDEIKWAQIQVGASFRQYVLNSQGTLFADTAGRIHINETGAFVQVQKSLFDDFLKITAAGRYDKNENFKGRFTPRITALLKVAEDNNIRLSYQTGYRFPSTQNQYINLNTGYAKLIGGLPQFQDYYGFKSNPVYDTATINHYSAGTGALTPYQFKEFKPESVSSYEIGYKGLINKKILIDFYAYYAHYNNFITSVVLEQNPGESTQQTYGMAVNSNDRVNSYGGGVGIDYLLQIGFVASGNVSYTKLTNKEASLVTFFNTPNWKYNLTLANYHIAKVYGFNVTYRWQSHVDYQATFISGRVPSFGTLDAQISRKLPDIRSMVKIGATNLLNKYYTTAMANPAIGGLYYISFGYNIF